MASIQFTDADRDHRGFIRLSPPDAVEAAVSAAPAPPLARAAAPVRPPLSAQLRYQFTIAGAIVAGLLLVLLSMRFSAPAPIGARTAIPTARAQSSGEGIVTSSPIPATSPGTKEVYGYWAPDGMSAGVIDLTKIVRVVELRGVWARIEMEGGGLVWTETQAIPAALLHAYVPPIAPAPTPVPFVPEPTTPPPPPTQCAAQGVPGKMVSVCGTDELSALEAQAKEQWIATYGGNVGIVGTPSPQIMRKP